MNAVLYILGIYSITQAILWCTDHKSLDMEKFTGEKDVHGKDLQVQYDKDDYFKFFNRLGKVEYPCVKVAGNIIIGIVCVWREMEGKSVLFVSDFRVSPEYRGYGLGTLFLSYIA